MGLKTALTKLNSAVKDLTSLHVQTFSGEINIPIPKDADFDNIKTLLEKAKADGKIILVAETLAQFDGDSYNFVKQNLDEVPKIALEVHNDAVKAGIETRLGLLDLFKELFT